MRRLGLGKGKGKGRGLKYDPDQDCFVIPGQKHSPGMPKAEAHPPKKPKVKVKIDEVEDAAVSYLSKTYEH